MKIIHLNVHFAIGVILASIFHYYFNFNLLEFSSIILCSFIMDFDFLLSQYAKDRNHRMLITHSIYPGMILMVFGIILQLVVLIFCGIAYIIHVIVDAFDWGTNLFGIHEKPFGPKLLVSKEEFKNMKEVLEKYKVKKSFFDFRYYSNRSILTIEILLATFMMIFIIINAFEYVFISLIYIPFLLFHLLGYFHLKKIEAE